MDEDTWKELLDRLSRAVLDSPELGELSLPTDALESGWLGFPPASDAQIAAAEARLGVTLPPSYRAFLRLSNGWRYLGDLGVGLRRVEDVDWFRVENQDWIDAYLEATDDESWADDEYEDDFEDGEADLTHLPGTLQISDLGDGAVLLLNPAVVGPDGEWEAWFFANWVPGANRYDSFHALLAHSVETQRSLNMTLARRLQPNDPADAVVSKLPGLIAMLEERADDFRGVCAEDMGYQEGTVEGLEEALAQVRALADLRDPDALHGALLELAAGLDAEAGRVEADLRAQTDPSKLLGSLSSMRKLFANMSQMLDGIRSGGRAQGLRQAAGVVRWYLGEG